MYSPCIQKTPSKTRQSALRSSMPVFSSSSVKQAGNPVPETGMCHKHEQKKSNKMSNVETDLAGLQAEVFCSCYIAFSTILYNSPDSCPYS